MQVANGSLKSGLLVSGLVLALMGGAIGLISALEKQRPAATRAAELLYLPKGEYLKVAVLGYRQIVADLIWLRVLQYVGVRDQTPEGYRWAYYAGDVLTDLDPKFVFAYQGLGTVFAIAADQVEESIKLLKKGMQENPEVWNLPFLLGYNYYFELHDPATAATYFQTAASLPGSPKYLPQLAARMMIEAGAPDAALEFLQRLYAQVQDEQIREGLALRIKGALVERDLRVLEEGVKLYRDRVGKFPGSLQDLVSKGILVRIPVDPFGGEYQVSSSNGSVSSTKMQDRFRLYKNCGGVAGHC